METPRQRKTALDRFMQVISLVVLLLVLSSALSSARSAEQSSPRTSQTRLVQKTPSVESAQQTVAAGQLAPAPSSQPGAATVVSGVLGRANQVEPLAGSWPTWVLKSGREIKVTPPPGAQATAAELDMLRDFVAQRDAETRATIQYWDAGSPSYRWIQVALQQLQEQRPSIPRANQALAMLNVAVYDSMVTTWQAKYTYNRLRPAQLAPDLAAIATPASPSYPDEHAAAAGAASAILSFLYPQQADEFADMAWQAAQAQVQAGVAFPSDVKAGLSLGQAVAERVIAYTGIGGADFPAPVAVAAWWNAPTPAEPLSPPWRPWTLTFAGEFLPAAPASDKAETSKDDLLRLQMAGDMDSSGLPSAALFWNSFAGSHVYWYDLAAQKMAEYHIDANPVRAARIYALMGIAHDDGSNGCWDAMYTYRVWRPSKGSIGDTTLLAPTALYSYPSAQACLAGSMSTVLGAIFPLDVQTIRAASEEAAQAGLWMDGTLPVDVQAGFALGRVIALRVLSHPLPWLWGDE